MALLFSIDSPALDCAVGPRVRVVLLGAAAAAAAAAGCSPSSMDEVEDFEDIDDGPSSLYAALCTHNPTRSASRSLSRALALPAAPVWRRRRWRCASSVGVEAVRVW
eukprot:COSAG02_NODE_2365_length_9052_cov_11.510779_2_plen_107_part_00